VKGGPVRFVAVPVTLPLAEIVERLNELQPPMLMGYPSILARLARERKAGRLRIAPQAVTTSSEPLTSEDRDLITDAFGVPVADGFGATEGLVGVSEPGQTILTFATDMCIAELVDAENQPVQPGIASAKVLVTNLHNLTQPLIRYELTDSFIQHPDAPGGFLRATVDGRADDAFRYGGVDVHPLAIRGVLVKTAAVREYQVHQTARGIDVQVVADASLDQAALAATLTRSLAQARLDEPDVAVHRIDAIAPHPQTGKIRRFVPLR
jgi:phenylacetate-coenzyme A ligase PaaK-like adenylate-forming protein